MLLYDEFDIWRVKPDGSGAAKLTSGAADAVRHRLITLDPDEDFVDLDEPAYVQLFGIWTKAGARDAALSQHAEPRRQAHVLRLSLS